MNINYCVRIFYTQEICFLSTTLFFTLYFCVLSDAKVGGGLRYNAFPVKY